MNQEANKPIETFYPDGKIQSRTYRNAKGLLHRDPKEGPAYTQWYETGQIYSQSYYTEGKLKRDPKEGPTYEAWHKNGQTYLQQYYVGEKLHRDPMEGPAIQSWYNNGQIYSQQYYVDGKFHRDPTEGPAYEKWHGDGRIWFQEYWADGKEVAAPKVEVKMKEEIKPIETFYPDGKIQSRTYLNTEGKIHRDPKEGPAHVVWNDNGQLYCQQYCIDGGTHRDQKEGPAYQTWDASGQIATEQYYVDGKPHRDPQEGAAHIRYTNGEFSLQVYYVNGEKIPAPKKEVKIKEVIKPIEIFYPSGKIQLRKYLNADKKLHRDPEEGPAYESWYENGQIYCQEYCVEGKVHRDPKEGPAYTRWHSNGQLDSQQYLVDGKEVPAPKVEVEMKEIKPVETFYPDGKIHSRSYLNAKGNFHRDSKEGPAFERWHDSGNIACRQYWANGIFHKDPKEGPASQNWLKNGQIESQSYHIGGMLHRDPNEGPASQSWHTNGQIYTQQYAIEGKLHRDPKEGPAYIRYDIDGTIYSQQYRIDGEEVLAPKVEVEMKEDKNQNTKKEELKPIDSKSLKVNNSSADGWGLPTLAIAAAAFISVIQKNKDSKRNLENKKQEVFQHENRRL